MVQIYWGLGKGKTSAANGAVIRAKGSGIYNPFIIRFLKGQETSEDSLLNEIGVEVISLQTSTNFITFMTDDDRKQSKKEVMNSIEIALKNHSKNNMIILDEFLDLSADNVNFISGEELLKIIKELDKLYDEVIITGHTELKKVFDYAHLITKMEPQKHYFDIGIDARDGIEK